MRELRIANSFTMHNNKGFSSLIKFPIVATGSLAELQDMCAKARLTFIPDNSLFGGYYQSDTGDCYFVT